MMRILSLILFLGIFSIQAEAACIFYRPDGSIYGVHPNCNLPVPSGIESIEVPEKPHEIAWPQLPDGRAGSEQTSRVDTVNKVLEVGDFPDKTKDEVLVDDLNNALTVNDLKQALIKWAEDS